MSATRLAVASMRLSLAVVLVSQLCACSTFLPKQIDTNKPIEFNRTFLGSPLKQDGESIDFDDAVKKLSENPEIKTHAERFRWLNIAEIVLELGGAVELIDGWGRNKSGNAAAGLAALGFGVGANFAARHELNQVVEIHNRRFPAQVGLRFEF